ncbi:hypothetical protein GCM10023172_29920 [Hymenobacter ginsengisoli]|uniref:Uncharacterized protein n=2 Tax=Hymenobacteraceae TaxID=1853232 RepID=A0ABP8QKD3_9BACT
MPSDELDFLEKQLAANELLSSTYGEETRHTHEDVLAVLPVATEQLMQYTSCQTSRRWIDWRVTKPKARRN